MTRRLSRRWKGKADERSYKLDPLDADHPAKTKICNALEIIWSACATLTRVEQVQVYLEIQRRVDEAAMEALHALKEIKEAADRLKHPQLPFPDEEA